MKEKIIQIIPVVWKSRGEVYHRLYALTEAGDCFFITPNRLNEWTKLPDIPQIVRKKLPEDLDTLLNK